MKKAAVVLISLLATADAGASGELDGLLGCWKNSEGNSVEVWTRTGDHELQGFGIEWSRRGPGAWETLRIRDENGVLILSAYPGGAPGTDFTLVRSSDGYVRFENREHDFPQVIEYWWTDAKMRARVSHLELERALEFRKIRCQTGN